MTLEQLGEFCTVARIKNITKAANALFISQPSLSRHIVTLEEDLNVRLIVRDNRRITLTEAGELLWKQGEDILGRVDRLEEAVRELGSGGVGRLSVASLNVNLPRFFSFCGHFVAARPDVSFEIRHHPLGAAVTRAVMERSADIGLGYSFELPAMPDQVETLVLERDELCAVVSGGHRLAKRGRTDIQSLREERLLLLEAFTEPLCQRFGLNLNTGASPPPADIDTHILQIRAGLGCSILPRRVAAGYAEGCAFLEIPDLGIEADLLLLWYKTVRNPSVSLFIRELEAWKG